MSYSHARAKLLHSLPLIFVLTTPLLRGSLLTKPPGLLQLGCGALACFASWVLAVLVPALLGMARVLVFGEFQCHQKPRISAHMHVVCTLTLLAFQAFELDQNPLVRAQETRWSGIPSTP